MRGSRTKEAQRKVTIKQNGIEKAVQKVVDEKATYRPSATNRNFGGGGLLQRRRKNKTVGTSKERTEGTLERKHFRNLTQVMEKAPPPSSSEGRKDGNWRTCCKPGDRGGDPGNYFRAVEGARHNGGREK